MSLVLVLGGVRSGKSEVAERLVENAEEVVYVATGSASDPEMAERIGRHRARRPETWRTVEDQDPLDALHEADGAAVLVDSTGPWIARLMADEDLWSDADVAPLEPGGQARWERALRRVRKFAEAAATRSGPCVLVGDEASLGLVPQGVGVRRYLDLAGEAAQILAGAAARVLLVVAGHPVELKAASEVVPWDLRLHADSMVPTGSLDFAINVAGEPPGWLRRSLADALGDVSSYPDESKAVRALAMRHGRAPAEILALNGSAEAFWLISAALRPRAAVCVHPSFTEAEVALASAGRTVRRVFRDPSDFSFDPSAIPDDADLVVVGNPNNPTGTLTDAATLLRVVRPGRVVVVDEAFMEFTSGDQSLVARGELPGVIVLRSITKLWALPGLRAGYLVGSCDLVSVLRRCRQPWSVNALALHALALCAADESTPHKLAEETAAAREELTAALTLLPGVRMWPSHTNFVLVRVPEGDAVRAGLLERGISVRPASTFPGLSSDHFRITVRGPDENGLLIAALKEAIA